MIELTEIQSLLVKALLLSGTEKGTVNCHQLQLMVIYLPYSMPLSDNSNRDNSSVQKRDVDLQLVGTFHNFCGGRDHD